MCYTIVYHAPICSKRVHSQAMGDNMVELIVEYSRALSRGEHLDSKEDKLIFWDFLGLIMVRKSALTWAISTAYSSGRKAQWSQMTPGWHVKGLVLRRNACIAGDLPTVASQAPAQDAPGHSCLAAPPSQLHRRSEGREGST